MAIPLKTKNIALILAVIVTDSIAIVMMAFPSELGQLVKLVTETRILAVSIMPVLVMLITSLIPAEAKTVLVFWRLQNALPGHRAFSKYATNDPRINLEVLKNKVGPFPEDPRKQNATWYGIYKQVENEPSVLLAHGQYLLFRELAVLSVFLIPIVLALLSILGTNRSALYYAALFFSVQYLVTTIAARNHGVGFVTNVLAVYASKAHVKSGVKSIHK